jgi:hypothetical protein
MVWSALAVCDDDELLALWLPPGAPCLRPAVRSELPYEQQLVERPWRAPGVLQLWPVGAAHAVWVFERGWYVNLQEPFRRTAEGYDTQDLELDIWVPVDGPWQWKDADVLDERIYEGRYTIEQVASTWSEGRRVAAELDAGRRWWDPWWALWEPDPAWDARYEKVQDARASA